VIARNCFLYPFIFDESPVMFSKHSELARFAFHCRVPHMRRINRDNEIYAIKLL
jgi:hypothetical protein